MLPLPALLLLIGALASMASAPMPAPDPAPRGPARAPERAAPAAARAGTGDRAETGTLIDGAAGKLYVEVVGERQGVPLVIVNGGPGIDHLYMHCSSAWDSLARTRPVVFYDQRGVGRSSRLPFASSLTTTDQVADLEAVRRHLGADRMDLLGHSYGGFLAMDYTIRNPRRVAHLILCDSSAPQWSATTNLLWHLWPDRSQVLDSVGVATPDSASHARWFRDFMSLTFHQPARRAEFLTHPEWLVSHPQINAALRDDMNERDLRGGLMQLGMQSSIPALVLTGRYDYVAAPSVAWELHNDLQGSWFHCFENSGHMPFFEEPTEFVNTVTVFLATR